jgi:hypothetical protein
MPDNLNDEPRPPASAPLPPILQLPNDILNKIFSFLIPPSSQFWGNRHPILTLRQVCRPFRAMANELTFWCTDDFDFSQIDPKGQQPHLDFIVLLIQDRHLASCIGEKRVWKFRSLDRLGVIGEHVPEVYTRTESLRLLWGRSKSDGKYVRDCNAPFGEVVDGGLGLFTALRRLRLWDVPLVNFDDISRCLPMLESLAVEFRHPHSSYGEWCGSLGGLSHLQKLSLVNLGYPKVDHEEEEREDEPLPGDPVPLNSVGSLFHLQVIGSISPRLTNLFAVSFDAFVNLTHLSLLSISDKVVAHIIAAKFRLRELRVKIWSQIKDAEACMKALLSAPALSDLETLELSFWGDPGEFFSQDIYFTTIESMVASLTTLQHVKLRMPLFVSMLSHFSKLENLKSIEWLVVVLVDDTVDDEGLFSVENTKDKLQKSFDEAFNTVAEKPVLNITLEAWGFHDVYDFDCFDEIDFSAEEVRPSVIGTGQPFRGQIQVIRDGPSNFFSRNSFTIAARPK